MKELLGKNIQEVKVWLFENGYVRKNIQPLKIEAGKILEEFWYEFRFYEDGKCYLVKKLYSEIVAEEQSF